MPQEREKDYGLLIAAIVAIVSIVGLVILFSSSNSRSSPQPTGGFMYVTGGAASCGWRLNATGYPFYGCGWHLENAGSRYTVADPADRVEYSKDPQSTNKIAMRREDAPVRE